MLDCMKRSSSSNNIKNPQASREQMSCDRSRMEHMPSRITINHNSSITIHNNNTRSSNNNTNNALHKLSWNQVFDVPNRLEEAVVGGVDMDAELLVRQMATRGKVGLRQLIGNKWQRPRPSLERHPSIQLMWMERPGWLNDEPSSSNKNKNIEGFWRNNSWKTRKESDCAARVKWRRSRQLFRTSRYRNLRLLFLVSNWLMLAGLPDPSQRRQHPLCHPYLDNLFKF